MSPMAVEVPPPPLVPSASRATSHPSLEPMMSRAPRWLVVAAAAAFGAAGTVAAQRALDARAHAGGAQASAASPAAMAAPAAASPTPIASCPSGMVAVRGGPFFLGSDDDTPDERPAHAVVISPFCIDATEVTVADYKACSDQGECKRASLANDWPGIASRDRRAFDGLCNARDPDGRASHPVNCVDWSMASTYCASRHARLPTEAEWELAARGPDGRRFPWGDAAPDATRANACGAECVAWGKKNGLVETAIGTTDDGFATTAPVGSFPKGASPFGVLDAVGNVWEWTADWYGGYPSADAATARNPIGPATGKERVVRGGAWNGGFVDWMRPSFRWKNPPTAKSYAIGFRCAEIDVTWRRNRRR